MQVDPIVLHFNSHQKWELQGMMSHLGKPLQIKHSKAKDTAQQLKEQIVCYIKDTRKQLDEKGRALDWVRDFLIEKKCLVAAGRGEDDRMGKEQVYEAIKRLRATVNQKQRDSECYNIYVSLMVQLCELDTSKLTKFQQTIGRCYKVMSYQQRDNISKVAKKIISINQLQPKSKNLQQLSSFFTKLMRYGINQQFPELYKINNDELQTKTMKLLEYLKGNFIQIQPTYGREYSIKEFVMKLSNTFYQKQEINKKLHHMHPKVIALFQPLVSQVYRLRDNSGEKKFIHSYSQGGIYNNQQIKKAEEESINQLISDLAQSNKRNDRLYSQLKQFKWFTSVLNDPLSLSSQDTTKEIKEFILKYSEEQLGKSLQRLYQKHKNQRPVQNKAKSALLNQSEDRLKTEIQRLKGEIKRYKDQNNVLNQRNDESLEERIQLLGKLQKFDEERKNEQKSRNKITQACDQKISAIQNMFKQVEKKGLEHESELEALRFTNEERGLLLEAKQAEMMRMREQNLLYEKAIVDLQNESVNKLISEEKSQKLKSKNQSEIEQVRKDLSDKIARIQKQLNSLKRQKGELTSIIGQKQELIETLTMQLSDKDERLNKVNAQVDLKKRSINESTVQLQNKIVQLINRNEKLTVEMRSLSRAKQAAQQASVSATKCMQQLYLVNKQLQSQLSNLRQINQYKNVQNKGMEKVVEELKNQIIQLVDRHQISLNRIQELERNSLGRRRSPRGGQCESQSTRDSPSSSRRTTVTEDQYRSFQQQLKQLRNMNTLIAKQYRNYKGQVKTAMKQLTEDEAHKTEHPLKESYKQLQQTFMSQREKLNFLKQENQQLREQHDRDSYEFSPFQNIQKQSGSEQRLQQLTSKCEQLQKQTQKTINMKQSQLAQHRSTIRTLEAQLQHFHQDLQQSQILRQKMRCMQEQIDQQEQTISYLRMQLQKKQQELIQQKISALEQQVNDPHF